MISSSLLLPSNLYLHILRYFLCLCFLDCLDLELQLFLHPIPQHHQHDLPSKLMAKEKTGLEVPHLKLEEKMPLSPTSDWILYSLVEEEDMVETSFH